jgi:hypothetical protein
MYHFRSYVVIVITFILSGYVLTVLYLSRSGRSEGRPNGMKYGAVVADLNSEEHHIIDASRMFSLPPRSFGAAIAAERAINFQPYLENIGDAIFGTSVGIAQVSTIAFRDILAELYAPESASHFRTSLFRMMEARDYFTSTVPAKRYQRKLRLLLDTEFDITAAAMILRHMLDRYEQTAPQNDVYHRPDLIATLYHRTFPDSIRGVPDEFGLLAVRFYNDTSFLPRSVLRKEVDHDRGE